MKWVCLWLCLIVNHLSEIIPKEGSVIGIATWQNGINTTREDFERMSDGIRKRLPEGILGLGIYNPTETIVGDLLRVGREFIHDLISGDHGFGNMTYQYHLKKNIQDWGIEHGFHQTR